jgi:hypothetical protein
MLFILSGEFLTYTMFIDLRGNNNGNQTLPSNVTKGLVDYFIGWIGSLGVIFGGLFFDPPPI